VIDQGANLVQIGSALAQALWSSLWIGALVAAFVFFYVRGNRGLNAASRHVAWYAALIVIAALPGVSFAFSLSRAHVVTAPPAVVLHFAPATNPATEPRISGSHVAAAAAPVKAAAPLLSTDVIERTGVIAGSLIAAIAFARITVLFVGLLGLWKVKRASRTVDPSLSPTLARTMARDADARNVSLRLSDLIDAPAAAGFRSPAILLPADLVDTLDRSSLDQIAMHEYAHLRRYDDWTNLFQRFVERVYWFNPAIWFVGGRIDLEREIACDDWAVAGADGVSGYADCLWHLARNRRVPSFAATAPGAFLTQNQIAARIEHLLQRRRDGAPTLRTSRLIAIAPVLAGALVLVAGRAPGISLTAPSPSPIVAQVELIPLGVHALTAFHGTSSGALANGTASGAVANGIASGAVEIHLDRRGSALSTTQTASATRCSGAAEKRTSTEIVARASTESSKFKAATRPQAAWIEIRPHTNVVPDVRVDVGSSNIDVKVKTQVSTAAVNSAPTAASAARTAASTAARAAQAAISRPANAAPTDTSQTSHDDTMPKHHHGISVHAMGPKHFTFVEAAADTTDNLSFGPNDRDLIAHCSGCDLSNKDLQNADLHGLTLTGDDLSGADLRGANLRQTTLTGVDLSNARLDGADLRGAVMTGTDISGATFNGARTDGIHLVGMQLTDAILTTSSARSIVNACAGCDLSNLDLHGRDLHGIVLDGADLSGTDLSGANLQGAHFNGVDFSNVKLRNADLRGAVFNGCDLSNVDLSQARTDGIQIRGSNLSGTDSNSDTNDYANDNGGR
jgi:uncharacterized protein YjbI with pentapeptide repeats/beta-lactamase regulating signal transducer with metallopeptidase domain